MGKLFAGCKLIRAPVPNQCQIITFLTLKTDNIAKLRIELKSILLETPSNKIKVHISNWYICDLVFTVSTKHRRKMWDDYWGRGAKGRGVFEMNCLFLSGDFKFQVSSKVLISCPRSTPRG